jgi:Tol biopolymer transport system component/predicted Ser/Thr protein kinase
MVGRTVAHYRIVAELGAGGMGIVYKAQDARLQRFLALKFLKSERVTDDFRRRFLQEARASSALHHPNIVHVYDIGVFEGQDFIAMEFVDGLSLRQILRERRLEVSEALRYTIQIADAMAAAHAAGIVHRDLKPGNLMITAAGLVKILDFGLAKFANQPAAAAATSEAVQPEMDPEATISTMTLTDGHTQVGVAVGSPAFMSPEQAMGKPVDGRSDIFSLGSILYELLTGRRAFGAPTTPKVISEVLGYNPPDPSSINPKVSEDLDSLVARALRKDPSQRFQSMDEFKHELETLHGDVSGVFALDSPVLARRRRRTAAIAAAAAILVVAPLAWYVSRQRVPKVSDTPLQAVRLTLDAGLNIEPAVSPDGKLVAYSSDRAGEDNLDIWVRPAAGNGEPTRVTRDAGDEHEPDFSPDGSQIAYRSERDGGAIYLVPARGGEQRRIIEGGRRPRFSPDGKQIAYWKGLADPFPLRPGNASAWVYDLATQQSRQILPEFPAAADPIWSPDGRYILIIGVKDADNIAGTFNWYVLPAKGGPAVLCPANTRYLLVPYGWWRDRILCGIGGHTMGSKIGQVRIDEKTLQPVAPFANLTAGITDEFTPTISRDGLVVFASETRYTNVHSLPLDVNRGVALGPPKQLSRNLGEDSVRSVSSDGNRIAFLSRRPADGPAQIWVRDIAAGEEHAITTGGVSKTSPEINPAGTLVAWRVNSSKVNEIFVTPFAGGEPTKLCDACQSQVTWSADGGHALFLQPPPRRGVGMVEISTGHLSQYMADSPGSQIRARAISRDNRWLAFSAGPTQADFHIYIAPFSPHAPPPRSEWIDVIHSADVFPYPRWSPDGNLLYVGSSRDGKACLWAQRLNPATKRPEGPLFAVQHFHKPTEEVDSPSLSNPLALSDTGAVLSITERTSGLWQIDFGKAK